MKAYSVYAYFLTLGTHAHESYCSRHVRYHIAFVITLNLIVKNVVHLSRHGIIKVMSLDQQNQPSTPFEEVKKLE